MDKKTTARDILTVFLIVVSLLGIWQLILVSKELESSQNKLQDIQAKVDLEKAQYKLQIDGLSADIESTNKQLEDSNQQLEITVKQLDTANKELILAKTQLEKLSVLETENSGLLQSKQTLEQKIADLENESRENEAKLHSLPHLRKLMRQVKLEIHEQNFKFNFEKHQQQKELDAQKTLAGNRGFIIKNNKSTYKNTVRIEVKPGN